MHFSRLVFSAPHLPTICRQVLELRKKLAAAISKSVGPLDEYAKSLQQHEKLLARDEEAYIKDLEDQVK